MVPVRACKDQTLLEIQNCVSNRLLDSVSSKWGCYQSTYGSDAYATYLRKKATCFFCNSILQQLTLQGVADTGSCIASSAVSCQAVGVSYIPLVVNLLVGGVSMWPKLFPALGVY